MHMVLVIIYLQNISSEDVSDPGQKKPGHKRRAVLNEVAGKHHALKVSCMEIDSMLSPHTSQGQIVITRMELGEEG